MRPSGSDKTFRFILPIKNEFKCGRGGKPLENPHSTDGENLFVKSDFLLSKPVVGLGGAKARDILFSPQRDEGDNLREVVRSDKPKHLKRPHTEGVEDELQTKKTTILTPDFGIIPIMP